MPQKWRFVKDRKIKLYASFPKTATIITIISYAYNVYFHANNFSVVVVFFCLFIYFLCFLVFLGFWYFSIIIFLGFFSLSNTQLSARWSKPWILILFKGLILICTNNVNLSRVSQRDVSLALNANIDQILSIRP